MKKCIQKVFRLLKRFFFFLKLHIHVEAGLRSSNKSENNDSEEE